MILASRALPRPPVNPFEREAHHNTLSALPALHGTIAVSLPVRANSGRDTPGTFGTPRLYDANQPRGCLFTRLHSVTRSFVAAAHDEQHAAGAFQDAGNTSRKRGNFSQASCEVGNA